MKRVIIAICLVLMLGLGAAQPISFESSGSVWGHGTAIVQQTNPYNWAANYYYYGGWGNWFWEQTYYPSYSRYWGYW